VTRSGLACVNFVKLFRIIQLYIVLCCLVLFVSTLAKRFVGKTYSHDIFRVEGFPLQRPIEELFIVVVSFWYSQHVTFSLISIF